MPKQITIASFTVLSGSTSNPGTLGPLEDRLIDYDICTERFFDGGTARQRLADNHYALIILGAEARSLITITRQRGSPNQNSPVYVVGYNLPPEGLPSNVRYFDLRESGAQQRILDTIRQDTGR